MKNPAKNITAQASRLPHTPATRPLTHSREQLPQLAQLLAATPIRGDNTMAGEVERLELGRWADEDEGR